MIIESISKKRKKEEKNKSTKVIKSLFNIFNTPRPQSHNFLKNIILSKQNNKLMKDNETNTDSFSCKNNLIKRDNNISTNRKIIEIISLKNKKKYPKTNIFISHLFNNNNLFLKKYQNHKSNNSTRMPKIKHNKYTYNIEKIKSEENIPLKKRYFSSHKKQINKSLIFDKNILNKIINQNLNQKEISEDKIKKRKNLVDLENSMNLFKKKINKKINNFFNNKYLQENTDIYKVGKNISNNKNNKDISIKFSLPKNCHTNNVIVDNNISLENTFKEQTLSNFNNKYNFKFKTNNMQEKEKIKKLFYLLKKHKDSETEKNYDFLAFNLYKQKKLRKKEITKAILEEYSGPCVYIGRNKDSFFINKEYYTNKNDFDYENTYMPKIKENKMIRIKSLSKNI